MHVDFAFIQISYFKLQYVLGYKLKGSDSNDSIACLIFPMH